MDGTSKAFAMKLVRERAPTKYPRASSVVRVLGALVHSVQMKPSELKTSAIENHVAVSSIKSLAARCYMHEETVRLAIEVLVRDGLVRVNKHAHYNVRTDKLQDTFTVFPASLWNYDPINYVRARQAKARKQHRRDHMREVRAKNRREKPNNEH